MFCNQYANQGILYLYGELENHEKELFEIHLARCKDCQAELALLQTSKKLTQQLPFEDIEPISYRQFISLSKSSDNVIVKYRQIFSDFIGSIFQAKRRFVFVPAVMIVLCLILIYLFKPSIPPDHEMLFAWDNGWEESFDQLDQKIAQLNLENLSTEADLFEEISSYSSIKVDSDEKFDQLEAEIELLSNELAHLNF